MERLLEPLVRAIISVVEQTVSTLQGSIVIDSPACSPDSITRENRIVHLRHAGTSVVVDLDADPTPAIIHWGEELRDSTDQTLVALAIAARPQRVSGGLDATPRLTLLPTPAGGWLDTPAIEGHRDGFNFSAKFTMLHVEADGRSMTMRLSDAEAQLAAVLELKVGDGGLLHQRLTLSNTGDTPYTVQSVMLSFPLPWDAAEIEDTTGHHLRERSPQRRPLTFGTYARESRRGRPGADSTVLLAVGQPGFGFESGRVHGIHVAWSGNQRFIAERTTAGEAFLGGGELFLPGEGILEAGDRLTSPWVIGSWGHGLNELSHRFHVEMRQRATHPRRPRPVTLNTWEAVYFDHRLDTLTALADRASQVGVERFVLDDGWFVGRRDDTAGLGDWLVDTEVWPDGLHPLADHVTNLGMEFGLWVEPEMINPNSSLAREHPDWILRARHELPPPARQQQVLNLADAEAYAYVLERLNALLSEYPIAYLKWDHNRDLVDAGSGAGGRPQVREQTLALYRLLAELKAAHPGLEIESCASGGARVDLGILEFTDRIWVSDTLDPLERLENQRRTGLVVPPELMGMHLTSPQVHSTGRIVPLTLSGAVALFGHFGIEWNLNAVDDTTLDGIATWVGLAKRLRPLVASGRVVHVDGTEPGIDVRGMVTDDDSFAVFTITQTRTSSSYPPGRIRLPGLKSSQQYRLTVLSRGESGNAGQSPLQWADTETVLTGRELAHTGVRPPVQLPQQSTVVSLTAVSGY